MELVLPQGFCPESSCPALGSCWSHPIQAGINWCCPPGRRVQSSKLAPSPPRLLSEEEYRLQGEVETQKALAELRSVCRSPDFHAWSTVSRIQSPKR